MLVVMMMQSLLTDEQIASAPILILGNKIDLPGAASEDEIRHLFGLHSLTTGKVLSRWFSLWFVDYCECHYCISSICLMSVTTNFVKRCLVSVKQDTDLCLCGEIQMMSHIVEYCRLTAEWQFILAALCRWRCRFLADQFWPMTRIRERKKESEISGFLPRDAIHKCSLCRHAVSVCVSVRHIRESCQNE